MVGIVDMSNDSESSLEESTSHSSRVPTKSIAMVLDVKLSEYNQQQNKMMVIKTVMESGSASDKTRAQALLSKALDEIEKCN